MAKYTLKNDELEIIINTFGAELNSVKDVKNGIQYLWSGDKEYWNRQAPVLFPIVGNLKEKKYTYNGKEYSLNQHGFARDMEFELENESDNLIWFVLKYNDETLAKYPFKFILHIGYKLVGRTVEVLWKIENHGEERMPFSIGGHPAFMCPIDDNGKQEEYFIQTNAKDEFVYGEINMDNGLLVKGIENSMKLDDDGVFPIAKGIFAKDALVIEGKQLDKVSLLLPNRKPYVTVEFDMPLCGIWSSAYKSAPFVCIEPWCGRCDYCGFEGDIFDKEYINIIENKEVFEKNYSITFCEI